MKYFTLLLIYILTFLSTLLAPFWANAQGGVAGLDTNGATFQIDQKIGTLTEKANEPFNAFSLGATTRRGSKFFYVVEPSGTTENALYTVTLKTGAIIHVDLDRDDSVRALFFKGKKLYGVFYDGNAGSLGIYRIAPSTGVTTLVLDLSDLDVDPIPGAFTEYGGFFYILVKPEIDSEQRKLLRFKTKQGSAKLVDVVDNLGNPVLCEKLKPNASRKNFLCLASAAAETQVNVCRLALNGKANCIATLADILRVGGGHTMLTPDRKIYYAFVYAPGETDNQRLIKFNAKGVLKSNITLDTIFIGAHFKSEVPPS